MNDFLTNLLARNSAETPAVRPRLPSLFETAAGNFGESHFAENNSTVEQKSVEGKFPNSNPPPLGKNQSGNSIVNSNLSEVPKNLPVENEFENTSEVIPKNSPQFLGKSENEFDHAPAPLPKPIQPSPEIHPNVNSPREKFFSEKNRARENSNASARAENFLPKNSPTINVTIGRVEVRAIQNSAPARKVAKPAPPLFLLDDYLRKNNGGSP